MPRHPPPLSLVTRPPSRLSPAPPLSSLVTRPLSLVAGALCLWLATRKKPVATALRAHGAGAPAAAGSGADGGACNWVSALGVVPSSDLALSGSADGFLRFWRCDAHESSLEQVYSVPVPGERRMPRARALRRPGPRQHPGACDRLVAGGERERVCVYRGQRARLTRAVSHPPVRAPVPVQASSTRSRLRKRHAGLRSSRRRRSTGSARGSGITRRRMALPSSPCRRGWSDESLAAERRLVMEREELIRKRRSSARRPRARARAAGPHSRRARGASQGAQRAPPPRMPLAPRKALALRPCALAPAPPAKS